MWVILGSEFLTRLWASHDRRAYLRGHWIDAIALIPAARMFRVLRLFRLIRLVRAFAGIYRAMTAMDRLAQNRQLIGLFLAWLAVAFICSTALYLAEFGVNDQISDPFDALWWASRVGRSPTSGPLGGGCAEPLMTPALRRAAGPVAASVSAANRRPFPRPWPFERRGSGARISAHIRGHGVPSGESRIRSR